MLFIRSAAFSAVMILSAIIYAVPSVMLFPFPFRQRYGFIKQWARFVLWWLKVSCRIDFVVEGGEHIGDEAAVVLCKHQSAWETLALQEILPPQVWVLKRELLFIPFFGWGLAMMEPIAIDRKAGKKALSQVLKQGKQRLDDGRWVVVFPEGTRTAPGHKGNYRMGGTRLAVHTGRPIIPIAHNAGEFWGRRQFVKQPGTITLRIGPPIPTEGRKAEEVHEQAVNWIEAQMDEITDDRFKANMKQVA